MTIPYSNQIFILLGSTVEVENKGCAHGWEEKDGRCYYWSKEKLFWGEAEEKCKSFGGHLASVTSQDVHDYLKDNVTFINQSVLYGNHMTHFVGKEP